MDFLANLSDRESTKEQLFDLMNVTTKAAHQYARLALTTATDILEVAMDGGPCAAAYTSTTRVQQYDQLAREALDSATIVSNMLIKIHESTDDEANDAYIDYLVEMIQPEVISSLLQGAQERVTTAWKALPPTPEPAARFNPLVFHEEAGAQES